MTEAPASTGNPNNSPLAAELILKFKDRNAKIGIVGLGYVGLPLVLRFAEQGFPVTGFDIDQRKNSALSKGESYIDHISSDDIAQAVAAGFTATDDFSKAAEMDALILCVPTPLSKYRDPDLSFVIDTTEMLVPYLRKGQLLSLESTTYPGTTEEELLPRVASRDLTVGADFFLVYSPEREDPGNPNFETRTIPKVCGGMTENCLLAGVALYEQVIDQVVPVSNTRTAEMTKLLENIHRAVNIGLVNEMKIVADQMDIDIHEVIDAAATKPFGFTAYRPGPGLGGHCIPIDPFYLTWKAKEYNIRTRFIELAGEINSAMPDYVISKVTHALNERKKSVNGSNILLLGLAYKKNVDDMRESPSVALINSLIAMGANVDYTDPHIPSVEPGHGIQSAMTSIETTAENLASYDCILIATDHDQFDYDHINEHAALVVDTRGRYRSEQPNIVKA